MSRIGYKPISIPAGIEVFIADGPSKEVRVHGPRGTLTRRFRCEGLSIEKAEGTMLVTRNTHDDQTKALHGLVRSELANMVHGVEHGYEKKLEVTGVGYKVQLQGRTLTLVLGYSHPVVVDLPEGIDVVVEKQTVVTVRGADKTLVGQFAANIRGYRPPEPYQGKGVKYQNEKIARKEGKKGK